MPYRLRSSYFWITSVLLSNSTLTFSLLSSLLIRSTLLSLEEFILKSIPHTLVLDPYSYALNFSCSRQTNNIFVYFLQFRTIKYRDRFFENLSISNPTIAHLIQNFYVMFACIVSHLLNLSNCKNGWINRTVISLYSLKMPPDAL